ncbi:hypothetical protein Bbelb_324560 [Branchiostoma belcheri]|nr:hypothetical protein Bbelb_324560 [Branchiostoma belcheri]
MSRTLVTVLVVLSLCFHGHQGISLPSFLGENEPDEDEQIKREEHIIRTMDSIIKKAEGVAPLQEAAEKMWQFKMREVGDLAGKYLEAIKQGRAAAPDVPAGTENLQKWERSILELDNMIRRLTGVEGLETVRENLYHLEEVELEPAIDAKVRREGEEAQEAAEGAAAAAGEAASEAADSAKEAAEGAADAAKDAAEAGTEGAAEAAKEDAAEGAKEEAGASGAAAAAAEAAKGAADSASAAAGEAAKGAIDAAAKAAEGTAVGDAAKGAADAAKGAVDSASEAVGEAAKGAADKVAAAGMQRKPQKRPRPQRRPQLERESPPMEQQPRNQSQRIARRSAGSGVRRFAVSRNPARKNLDILFLHVIPLCGFPIRFH